MTDPTKPGWTFSNPEAPATPAETITVEVAIEDTGDPAAGLARSIYKELLRRQLVPQGTTYTVTIRALDISSAGKRWP